MTALEIYNTARSAIKERELATGISLPPMHVREAATTEECSLALCLPDGREYRTIFSTELYERTEHALNVMLGQCIAQALLPAQ